MGAEDLGVRKDRFVLCRYPWLSRGPEVRCDSNDWDISYRNPLHDGSSRQQIGDLQGWFSVFAEMALPTQFALSYRVPPRDLAVLLCNKSNAFCGLGKWDEAFVAAKECLRWDPTYVKVW